MAQQQRTVAAEIVDILVAVDVPLARAGGAGGIDRIGQQRAAVVRQACGHHLAGSRVKLGRTPRARPILGLDLGVGPCLRHCHRSLPSALEHDDDAAGPIELGGGAGGTTHVASYSSTMRGPARGLARSERRRMGVSIQPSSPPKYARRGGPGSGSARLDTHRGGHAAPFAHALADDADRYQLDRLLRAGAVAIGALVLGPEGLLQVRDHGGVDRPVGHRDDQVEALPLVVQRRRSRRRARLPAKPSLGELGAACRASSPQARSISARSACRSSRRKERE